MMLVEERIDYLKVKAEDPETPLEEKFDIIEFLMKHIGMLGNKFNSQSFIKELSALTLKLNFSENI